MIESPGLAFDFIPLYYNNLSVSKGFLERKI